MFIQVKALRGCNEVKGVLFLLYYGAFKLLRNLDFPDSFVIKVLKYWMEKNYGP